MRARVCTLRWNSQGQRARAAGAPGAGETGADEAMETVSEFLECFVNAAQVGELGPAALAWFTKAGVVDCIIELCEARDKLQLWDFWDAHSVLVHDGEPDNHKNFFASTISDASTLFHEWCESRPEWSSQYIRALVGHGGCKRALASKAFVHTFVCRCEPNRWYDHGIARNFQTMLQALHECAPGVVAAAVATQAVAAWSVRIRTDTGEAEPCQFDRQLRGLGVESLFTVCTPALHASLHRALESGIGEYEKGWVLSDCEGWVRSDWIDDD